MKRFFMFSVSVLCLAVAVLIGFYVGSQQVEAQESAIAGFDIHFNARGDYAYMTVIMSNGDTYRRRLSTTGTNFNSSFPLPQLIGNYWGETE